MRLYWWRRGIDASNFGDRLGPILLERFGIPVEYAPIEEAEAIAVGSILARVPRAWTGMVLGSGFIRTGQTADLRRARVVAVRGALSRRAAGLSPRSPLGDLGVLVPDLEIPDRPAVDELLVPHYVDRTMIRRHPGIPTADILGDPLELLGSIASAGLVRTSSLHALIAADALGVRHVLEPHESVNGGLYKFRDYASSLDADLRPYVPRLSSRSRMTRLRLELRSALESL